MGQPQGLAPPVTEHALESRIYLDELAVSSVEAMAWATRW